MHIETITLHDEPGSPTIEGAECDDRGWNGFHVPTLTAEQVQDYFRACREFDAANGVTFDQWPAPFVDEAGNLRIPAVDDLENRESDSVWSPEPDGRYAVDGLVWTTADEEDE